MLVLIIRLNQIKEYLRIFCVVNRLLFFNKYKIHGIYADVLDTQILDSFYIVFYSYYTNFTDLLQCHFTINRFFWKQKHCNQRHCIIKSYLSKISNLIFHRILHCKVCTYVSFILKIPDHHIFFNFLCEVHDHIITQLQTFG